MNANMKRGTLDDCSSMYTERSGLQNLFKHINSFGKKNFNKTLGNYWFVEVIITI